MNIDRLIDKSIFILREAKAKFTKPAIMWSSGKDSTATLSLAREAFYNSIPWPVIFIDTGHHSKTLIDFRDEVVKKWDLDLKVAENTSNCGLDHHVGTVECCTKLKTIALKNLLQKEKYDALIVSIRRDENAIRSYERFFSPRDNDFKWKLLRKRDNMKDHDSPYESLQDTELSGWDLFASDFGPDCNHVRIHPLLPWMEDEIWYYTKLREIPINPLYWKGYRSLGCEPCTVPIWDPVDNIDEIITRIQKNRSGERSGRAQDKEDEYRMQKLRALGYM